MGDLTKNFSLSEFAQRDPYRPVPAKYRPNALRLARQLQPLRDVVGRIVITSGWRSLAKNTKIGGATKSQHLTGKAADFTVPGVSNKDVYCTILRLIAQGKMDEGGLGWYGERTANRTPHIHYDMRGFKRRWNKSGGPLPVCPPVKEDNTMATAFKVAGQGNTVWLYNGTQLHRYASGLDLARDKRLGLVPDKAVPTKSKADFQAIRRKLGID